MENTVTFGDKELVLHEFKRAHANGGKLEKFWVEDIRTGRQFLIKGSGFMSYEPFSERIAYIIGKDLGIDVLEYDILPARLFKNILPLNPFCSYISICEKIDRKNYSITSVAEIKRALNVVRDENEQPITNREVMYRLLDKKYIDTMILFDAIIGNVDRHYGNVHILRGIDGKMVGAPLLDNGASMLAQSLTITNVLLGNKVGMLVDKSSTMESTHIKQIKYIKSLHSISFNIPAKTIQILNDLEPTLQLLPKVRQESIKRYITFRLHKYLGYIKHNTESGNTKLINIDAGDIIKEIDHT